MALYNVGDRSHPITTIPHQLLFNGWKSRLERLELQAIEVEFDRLVRNKKAGEISTANWLPAEICPLGRYDWDGSPFMKIWDKACERDRARTCWCFGLMLWEHMIGRTEDWYFKTADLDNAPMAATRYYRCGQYRDGRRGSANSSLRDTDVIPRPVPSPADIAAL